MNTVENNKLIVEFMELIPAKVSTDFYALAKNHVHITGKNQNIVISGFSECAKYHSDWNWLMEVVEKIKKETNEDDFLSRLTTSETRKAIDLETTLENCFRKSYLSIEAVYNACVEFIKWYNQQKQ